MKIGLDLLPQAVSNSYLSHLDKTLSKYAPEHDYFVEQIDDHKIDLYHCLKMTPSLPLRSNRAPMILTITNLHFLLYPHLYSAQERHYFRKTYCRMLREADRLIAINRQIGTELSHLQAISPEKIDVILPLAATPPAGDIQLKVSLDKIRAKYALPKHFVLMIGTADSRHNYRSVLAALTAIERVVPVVICGRRTAHSEQLVDYLRTHHLTTRVEFIYELSPNDLPALFQLARAFVYLPDAEIEASIIPIVEALRARLPMILSDTPLNRDAASEAALYVDPHDTDQIAGALVRILYQEPLRIEMQQREQAQAELYSEFAVAQRLIGIYNRL